MSRVDEAMRRAATQGAGAPRDAAADMGSMASEALASEAFPDEATAPPRPEGRPVWAAPVTGGTRSAGDEPGSVPPEGSSVFERLDARLSGKVVVDAAIDTESREQYRRLAAVLHDAQGASGLRVIMVASALAGEGKTLTSSNLALTFSESYRRRVLLIDADLRRPTIDTLFRIQTVTGLSDGLADPDAKLVVRQVSSHLAVLPAGRPNMDPMADLTSARMRQLLAEARATFDWVIVDTPPLGLLPDAHLLSSMVDGAVMVVRANSTPHDAVKRAVEAIGRTRILGVVLNGGSPAFTSAYYGYGYGYGHRPDRPTSGALPLHT